MYDNKKVFNFVISHATFSAGILIHSWELKTFLESLRHSFIIRVQLPGWFGCALGKSYYISKDTETADVGDCSRFSTHVGWNACHLYLYQCISYNNGTADNSQRLILDLQKSYNGLTFQCFCLKLIRAGYRMSHNHYQFDILKICEKKNQYRYYSR